MANENEKERLSLEEELVSMLQRRGAALDGIQSRQRDISVSIQDSLRDTSLTAKEVQKIQSITNYLVQANDKLKTFSTSQLGTKVKKRMY